MDNLTGSTLNDFKLLRLLGRGAMATVYLAEQQSLARLVALKVLNADLCKDDAYVARFQHEARSAASLVHSHIAQIYEVGVSDGRYYFAQEYLAGGSLGRQLERQGPLSAEKAFAVLGEVAMALDMAAEKGIVHRDIKPDNLLLDRSGAIKVADFGLARSTVSSDPSLTQEGITLGTPLYMSPEQIEGRPVDSRSDLYSLGVTVYHLLAGAPPFMGDTAMAVAAQHLRTTVPALDTQVPDLPIGLVDIVHRLMAKKPADRFESPAVLLAVLTESGTYSTSSMPQASPQAAQLQDKMNQLSLLAPPVKSKWRRNFLIGAAALALGALFGTVLKPPTLLSEVNRGAVEREDSIAMQLYRAKILNTSEGWQAVEKYYPDADEYYHLISLRGLTESLFAEGRYRAAISPLNRLAARESEGPEFSLYGEAGLVVAYTRLGRTESAKRARGKLPVETSWRAQLRRTAPLMADALEQAEKDLEASR